MRDGWSNFTLSPSKPVLGPRGGGETCEESSQGRELGRRDPRNPDLRGHPANELEEEEIKGKWEREGRG